MKKLPFLLGLMLIGGWRISDILAEDLAAAAPYANDLGPAEIDLSQYPETHQQTFKGAFQKCAKCHSLARPLNSEFVELSKKETAKIQETDPNILKEELIWKIDESIWNRYVKRMMRKPSSGISSKEGKAIWEFLVFDSKKRKLGENKAAWREHRQSLLKEFKEKHPERYQEIYGEKSPK